MADVKVYLTYESPRNLDALRRTWTACVDVDGRYHWDGSGESPEAALMDCLQSLAKYHAEGGA